MAAAQTSPQSPSDISSPSPFADRLVESVRRKGAPTCIGIDPMVELFPDDLRPADLNDADACVDAIYGFTMKVLEAVAPVAAAVKFQSAYFEKYLWDGVEAYYSLIAEARRMGLPTIGDVKRGDIGSTSAAYAEAHLGDPPPPRDGRPDDEIATPDAITINAFLGMDAIRPFVDAAADADKGLFVLVRTSNPGSADLQDAKTADGRTFSELLADTLAPIAAEPGLLGSSGWSGIGAVVGATQPHTMASLRQRLPRSIFLLPGYGTQGATAEMTKLAFTGGRGAIVSASRSVLYAYREKGWTGGKWTDAVKSAAERMAADLRQFA
jgi:orotidine-5'-phosphate decarboxylase